MAFRLPTFNITCNIYTNEGTNPPVAPPVNPPRIAAQQCGLAYGERVNVASTGGTANQGIPLQTMNLLLPPLVDIRGPQDPGGLDMVECPAGSGRWYAVYFVDDIGKGYANEHRSASLLAIGGTWTPPYL